MLGTAIPMGARGAAEAVISAVNITSAREGVEGHGRSTSGGGHRRHVRSGSRAAPRARGGGLLGDVVWPVPHGGAHHGPARWGVPRQAEVREDGRRRKPEDGDALQRAVDSEYSILQGRAPRGHTGGRLSEAGVRAEDPAAHAVAASRRPMRASTARLMNSPVRIADLTFPQVNRLIHRTRLAFIHLDNLLAFAKRDRDGRVDGYITAYLPDECLLLFFRKGEAVNAASLHTTGRQVVTITEALKRMRGEVERGELMYAAAPMEQLAWMYQSCAAPVQSRFVDPEQPGAFFPALQQEQVSGVLELISNGRVSYLRFENGRFTTAYFLDRPEALPVGKYIESRFAHTPDGATPAVVACLFPPAAELPAQAANALINTYRELYWRIVDEVDKEFPGEAKRRASRVCAGIVGTHRALSLLSVPRGADTPDAVVQPDELSSALTDWSLQLLEGVEVVMPGTAPKILREATKEHRYVLQAAGFYTGLPWQVAW